MSAARLPVALAGVLAAACVHAELLDFSPGEVHAILRHGPWPQAVQRDASNRVSGKPEAIALGEALFFEPRLSPRGSMSCAHCHAPAKAWTDGRMLSVGLAELPRNVPTLWNAAFERWFGWDGGSDSLWSFALRPVLHPKEMGASADHVARTVRGDRVLAARYPIAAQRGLRIFVGKGSCNVCHLGPSFTHGEFADIGIRFFAPGGVDPGRYAGIRRLAADRFNLLGGYNDDRSGRAAAKTRHVHLQPRNFGEFKVTGLRNVALTAPYMHNGSLATLADVVRHYSELDEDRLHADGERILRPLKLTAQESADLVAFLESLTDPGATKYMPTAPSRCATPRAR
jgi:cytochrome c peroxidase